MFINLMLIDPYFDENPVVLFKTRSYFDLECNYNDQIIQAIVYKSNNSDIKVFKQYTDSIHTSKLHEPNDDFQHETKMYKSNKSLDNDNFLCKPVKAL